MKAYIIKRLLSALLVLWGVCTITFFLMHSNSDDSVRRLMGQHASPDQIEELKRELGLNKPILVQYFDFVKSLLKLDLGKSIKTKEKVIDMMMNRFPNTALLAFWSIFIATIIGVSAGIISAVKQNTFLDKFAMSTSLFGISTPTYLSGLVLIILFIQKVKAVNGFFAMLMLASFILWLVLLVSLKIVDKTNKNEKLDKSLKSIKSFSFITFIVSALFYIFTIKRIFTGVGMWDSIIQIQIFGYLIEIDFPLCIVLPAITLGIRPAGSLARMTRSAMLEVIRQDYIRTARAKGLAEKVVIIKHALKNSLIPVITVIGLQFASLLSGAVLIETVFAWPGLGRLSIQALKDLDYPLVEATVLFVALMFVTANLLVDLTYAFLDPRIRYE